MNADAPLTPSGYNWLDHFISPLVRPTPCACSLTHRQRREARNYRAALFESPVPQPANVSPVVAQMCLGTLQAFKTSLNDNPRLQAKLHEFYLLNMAGNEGSSA
ncbi:hypothetical protein D9M68_851560 [compost metagenome]